MFNPLDHQIIFATPTRLTGSTWLSHVPFAMYLVDVLRPKIFVELGTYAGVSYCSFCQAVQTLQTGTRCYAIDTWQGDTQAGLYGNDVLADLRQHHDPLYAEFSTLIPCTFDDALTMFDDGSIDLLHIDGFHTYEAVSHDFDTWLPKMSNQGVILFHDTNVYQATYGVWKFWSEKKQSYPHFEMLHGYGLGVLAVGLAAASLATDLLQASPENQEVIRSFFSAVGARWELLLRTQSLQNTLAQQIAAINWLQDEMSEYQELQKRLPFRMIRSISRDGVVRTLGKIPAIVTNRQFGPRNP